jgi:hypothetical protein
VEKMDKTEMMQNIVHHTQLSQSIRVKYKRMITQFYLPDIEIERNILNYLGLPKFKYVSKYKFPLK